MSKTGIGSPPSMPSSKQANNLETVDILKLQISNPRDAVRSLKQPRTVEKVQCDVLVCGGGTGGIAATVTASAQGVSVLCLEETDWLGGQLTAQGVSALDENYLVETSGANRSYQDFRRSIRRHYRTKYKHKAEVTDDCLNPGNCWVSWLAFEPFVAHSLLLEMIEPSKSSGNLRIMTRTKTVSVKRSGSRIKSLLAVNLDTGHWFEIKARFFLDATELGDLLPLAQIGYRSGSEATGEPHAPAQADPENVQDFVYPFAVEFRPGESHVIEKPPHYEDFLQAGKFSFQGYRMFQTAQRVESDGRMTDLLPFWEYRRLLDRNSWETAPFEHDLAMINWDSNDLRGQNIIDKPAAEAADRLALAKCLSLGFLYWLQTEAPRDDGGRGYPELLLRPEVMSTPDGLAKYPYIRESRRINSHTIIKETDISAAANAGPRARLFQDSVGIGLYPIDIHGHQEIPGAAQSAKPFQIPLGALIPSDCDNLLAAAKNIGTTHITNGAYRLHPIEWAIGEAAGLCAAYCLHIKTTPAKLLNKPESLALLQSKLIESGAPLYWYDDVPTNHPAFRSIQSLAMSGIMRGALDSLSYEPDRLMTRREAARTLYLSGLAGKRKPKACRVADMDQSDQDYASVCACLHSKLLGVDSEGRFTPDAPLASGALGESPPDHPVTRAHFAQWLHSRLGPDT